MKVNIITTNNGVGLFQDWLVLQEALQGHQLRLVDWNVRNTFTEKAHYNLHLEHIRKEYLNFAWNNISVPNPEWFDRKWLGLVSSIQGVYAKTRHTAGIFKQYNSNTIYTGFTSIDRYSDVNKRRYFLHTAGKSSFKGTDQIVKAWMTGKVKGQLILITSKPMSVKHENISVHVGRLSDEELKLLQNACIFHLCPSRAEGFGHYINEARSCGGIVITTNAAPMNELVSNKIGRLVDCHPSATHNLDRLVTVDYQDLIVKCNELSDLSDKELAEMSDLSRSMYELGKKEFTENIRRLIHD